MIESELRDALFAALKADLLGPSAPDEFIPDPPTNTWIAGILYPRDTPPDAEADEQLSMGDDAGDGDIGTGGPATDFTHLPGSIGLTFAVDPDQDALRVTWSYGRYARERREEERGWRRTHHAGESVVPLGGSYWKGPAGEAAELEAIVRHEAGATTVSLFLTNRLEPREKGDRNQDTLFQPELAITAEGGGAPFLDRQLTTPLAHLDDEELSERLLYSGLQEFGTGHNVAVAWEAAENARARRIWSETIPAHEVRPILPEDGGYACLDMGFLASASAEEITQAAQPMLEDYARWIEALASDILPTLPLGLQEKAEHHLMACRRTLGRIREGLDALKEGDALQCFHFANEAMRLQRSHSAWALKRRRKQDVPDAPHLSGVWRPFQLAFLLLNIPPTLDPHHDDRDLVDLLWFPTGGGKTEAYLGVAAFTLALRRLRAPTGMKPGVGVLMRYTLRLLTLQQFQRATALICACEVLRRRAPGTWGQEPFRIGLWVGTRATPASVAGAQYAMTQYRRGTTPQEANPVQFPACPWCGEALPWERYKVSPPKGRIGIHCARPACDFHGQPGLADTGLPAVVTDEEVYALRPSLIIGTVDKFAQLTWKADTLALFGRDGRGKRIALPPSLVIMDELHLISGPLGSMVGIFETALDSLATDDAGVRPRYIASTATVRRAAEQCKALFARPVEQFPPPGLDARDSFFARERSDLPGRLYVGVNPIGKSGKTALLRTYAILLHSAWRLRAAGEAVDPWWTLIGYFNAIRELAGAIPLCEDDVNDRLRALARGQRGLRILSGENLPELTSRLTSTEVPEALAKLEQSLGGTPGPVDVALASNMISVGVDIDRLGLMVVAGQPKTTSEYIQATSRVGRRHPGLVVTVYRWTRPRDISHYERFPAYHQTLYRFVEATSVTPFAPQARRKALHAVLVALLRHLGGLPGDGDASRIGRIDDDTLERMIRILGERAAAMGIDALDVEDEARASLLAWGLKAKADTGLTFGKMFNPAGPSQTSHGVLMEPAPNNSVGWPTPTSLREVEGAAALYFLQREEPPPL